MNKTNLSSIAKFTGGSGFPEIYQGKTSGDYPFIKVSDMNLPANKKYITEANNYVDTEIVNRLNLQIFKKGTTVFAKVGAAILLNRCRKLVKNTILDNNMMGATPTCSDENYLFYVLSSFDFGKLVQTGALPSINQTLFDRLECIDYPLPEQRKIAHILSTFDAVIEKSEAAIAKYKAIKSGMMRDLFTRGIDLKTGKLRPSYEDAPELYKRSELGWVPKEWKVVRINQVSTLVTNGFVGVATPYYESSDNGITYLYGTNIRKDEITFDDIRYVSRQFHNKQVKSQLKTGDMLTVQSGHIGTSAIVPEKLGDANCHALIITRFVLSEIFPWFISYYLNSDIGMHGLEKLFIGSTIKHINTSELAKHLILKPDIEEQKEISKRIDVIELLLRNELEHFRKIQNLKSALMSDLLTGKVRVQFKEEKVEAQ